MMVFEAKLAELPEGEAKGDVAAIYGEIRAFARVPFVALIYRHLATRPGVLPWVWAVLRPGFASGAIPDAASRLAEAASLPRVTPIRAVTWRMAGLAAVDRGPIEAVLDAYDRANPINLLVVRLVVRMLSEDVNLSARVPVSVAEGEDRPRRAARPTIPDLPPLLPASAIPPDVSAKLSTLTQFGQPTAGAVTPSLYRHLAHWPGFLGLLPDRLIPLVRQGVIGRAVVAYRQAADIECAALLPSVRLARDTPGGAATPSSDGIASTLDAFAMLIPEMIAVGRLVHAMLPQEPI